MLPGLTFVAPIGTGGFADVYLYEQALPARRVAVKVLREKADAAGLAQFHAEANVMAQLSGHPSIVPIYQADVSTDGRAYLVMEYCPGPHRAQAFRVERLPVPEVLDLGVRIASAVETAHRAGILHRDIKPLNILTSAYGSPLLTDFGIASVMGDDGAAHAMSVPWSPPEVFDQPVVPDVRSDVYSLAATLYSLLAGRSPFEIPGAANDSATMIDRIERQDPSRVLRADVPDPLNDLLLRSLARRIDDRPESAMAFARALQEVQIGLGLPPTRLEVIDASPVGQATAVQDDRTEVKPISIIIPEALAERGTMLRPHYLGGADYLTNPHLPGSTGGQGPRPAGPAGWSTGGSRSAPGAAVGPLSPEFVLESQPPHATTASREARRPVVPMLVGAVLVAGIAAVAAFAFLGGTDDPADEPVDTGGSGEASPPVAIGDAPPTPIDLVAVRPRGGVTTLRWTNPNQQDGDSYLVQVGPTLPEVGEATSVPQPRLEVDARSGDQVCARIVIVRRGLAGPELEDCRVVP